ncbi:MULTISPECIES: Vgb family protein [unclassified Microbacterium]|uniref:Vgb family protein n=1 Tax=unclassified Microbacterium TaxID=2609290 RepID=UPI00068F0DEB|nr:MULTISPECIES: hypothetical protein [unclassified Microbacterium]
MADITEPLAAHSAAVLDYGAAGPYAVAFGSSGEMWITLVNTGELVRRSPDGREHRFTIGERPGQLAVTSEATWCAVTGADRIAIIASDDRLNFIDVPGGPYGIAAVGSDALVTLMQENKLAVVSRDGLRSEVAVPLEGAYPAMATAHRDGSVWVSLNQRGVLERWDAAGGTDLITLPDGAAPVGIAAAGEYVWSADIARGSILRVDGDRHVRDFVLAPDSRPHAVIADDTGCWFTEWGANRLGRITAEGDLAEFDLSGIGEEPHGLALDGDGVVWVAFESGVVAGIGL